MKDSCIRELLKETELQHFLQDSNSKVVEELTLPIAKARIDMAVINGSLHGYEIKSACDTLQRLPSQIEAYMKVFDYLSIVTEAKYYERILNFVPSSIGIIICSEKNGEKTVEQVRKPDLNTQKDSIFLSKLLWREELVDTLTEYKLQFRKKDRNWLLCECIASNLNVETISLIVREKLKNRINWKDI